MALEYINFAWFIVLFWYSALTLINILPTGNGELGLKETNRISMFGKIEGCIVQIQFNLYI